MLEYEWSHYTLPEGVLGFVVRTIPVIIDSRTIQEGGYPDHVHDCRSRALGRLGPCILLGQLPDVSCLAYSEVHWRRLTYTLPYLLHVILFYFQKLLHISEDDHIFKFVKAKFGLAPAQELR